ncbi:PLP-dependent aminotransferase family protein, partial [Salmonella enterica subsp. enterica serovar Enteritidis]|nr:PLP-dependent aminotransferase family protein [Salmonella enterica subsp. enterica serovar Enteritidis]
RGSADSRSGFLRTWSVPGESMWVEVPGVPLIRPVRTTEGITLAPIPVDADGLNVEAGMRDCPQGRFAFVTPAHQSPLGVALSLTRRRQLLAWAAHVQAWIIEDDYDSEYRYYGKPPPPLQMLVPPQPVILPGSFCTCLS